MKETETIPQTMAETNVEAATTSPSNECSTTQSNDDAASTANQEKTDNTTPTPTTSQEDPMTETQTEPRIVEAQNEEPQTEETLVVAPQTEESQIVAPQTEETQNMAPQTEETQTVQPRPISFTLAPAGDMTDADREALTVLLHKVGEELMHGEIGEGTLRTLLAALHHDRDVAQASHEGEVRGRNANIEQLLTTCRENAEFRQISSSIAIPRPTPPTHIIGGLCAADRKSIWERGSEKRKRNH